jgi:peptidoglycan/xylan/chitin deacetylase (PgdA/CDA1 family)
MLHGLLAAALLAMAPAGGSRPVPILMYHVISAPPTSAPYPDLYVRPSDFAGEVTWLARDGYRAITLEQAYRSWTAGRPLPRRPVILSFDDGYLSDYTRAFPVLRRHHWPGVLNLQLDFLRPVGGLRPWRVRDLIAAGWEVDAHTFTHPDLTTVDGARLWREVDGSRLALRRLFHVPVDFFCYPGGRYDARVIRSVRRAGYLGATTTTYGLARPPHYFTLDRVPVDGSDGVNGLGAKLRRLKSH